MKKRIAIVSPAPLAQGPLSSLFDKWRENADLSFHALLPDASEKTAAMFPPTPDGPVLMLGVSAGAHQPIDIAALVPGIENIISSISADMVFFACAGDFPEFSCPVPIVQPARALRGRLMKELGPGARLGVITPGIEQIPHVRRSWQKAIDEAAKGGLALHVDWSPPDNACLMACAKRLADWGANYVAVECLGFSPRMGAEIAFQTGARVMMAIEAAAGEIEYHLRHGAAVENLKY